MILLRVCIPNIFDTKHRRREDFQVIIVSNFYIYISFDEGAIGKDTQFM